MSAGLTLKDQSAWGRNWRSVDCPLWKLKKWYACRFPDASIDAKELTRIT
jgi:hypothetical protein